MNVWRSAATAQYTDDPPCQQSASKALQPFNRFNFRGDKLPRFGLSRVVRIYRLPNTSSHRSSDSLVNPFSPPPPQQPSRSSLPSSTAETQPADAMSADNLNDIPAELRPLAPFLQRAQELRQKDPTMSYWCESLCLSAQSTPRLASLLLWTGRRWWFLMALLLRGPARGGGP